VVCELTPPAERGGAWTESIVHMFTGGSDGYYPLSGVPADAKGNLYGTTLSGGAFGFGTVFEVSPPAAPGGTWTESILYSFGGAPDGEYPHGVWP